MDKPWNLVGKGKGMFENTEPWEKSVPAYLLAAVKHLRDSFDRVHWGCSHTTERFCFAVLHGTKVDDPANEYINYLVGMKGLVGTLATQRFHGLIKQGTPPAFFKAYFDLYLDRLTVEALRIFHEMAETGRVNRNKLSVPHLEWAEVQVKHLIRSDRHRVRNWVQSVCDKQPHDPDEDEQIYWRKWQAPNFLIMKPSRYQAYDVAAAWGRNDAETSQRWLNVCERDYVLHVESHVERAAGEAALQMAKTEPRSQEIEEAVPPPTPQKPAKRIGKVEVRIAETQARYKRWRKEYRELKRRYPDMSDVRIAQKIAKLDLAEGHSAETIRKHMKS